VRKWLLAVVTVLGLAGAARADDDAGDPAATFRLVNRAASLCKRIEGRIRGSFIKPGMSLWDVPKVLGVASPAPRFGGFDHGNSYYHELGLQINDCAEGPSGAWVVEKVIFRPLFDD
jgi:hypothetical protein